MVPLPSMRTRSDCSATRNGYGAAGSMRSSLPATTCSCTGWPRKVPEPVIVTPRAASAATLAVSTT